MGRQVSGRLECLPLGSYRTKPFSYIRKHERATSQRSAGRVYWQKRVTTIHVWPYVFSTVGEYASWGTAGTATFCCVSKRPTTATFLYEKLLWHWPRYGIYKQATVTCPASRTHDIQIPSVNISRVTSKKPQHESKQTEAPTHLTTLSKHFRT